MKETVEIPQGRAYDTLERSTADFLPSATDQYSEEDITSPTEAYDYPPECVAAEECPVEEPAATVDDDPWATTVGKKNKKKAKKCQGFTGMKASETKCEERDW